MRDLTNNEMLFVLSIFKSPEVEYNASSIARHLGISAMGALKIAKRLERESIVVSRRLGKAVFYRLNFDSEYVRQYVKFLLKREAEQAPAYVKRWVNELKKVKSADAAILFGSVLTKHDAAKDIDVVFVTDKKRFSKLRREIEDINLINVKRVHPIYQSGEDFRKNIEKGDGVILNAIKGILVFGEDALIRLMVK